MEEVEEVVSVAVIGTVSIKFFAADAVKIPIKKTAESQHHIKLKMGYYFSGSEWS